MSQPQPPSQSQAQSQIQSQSEGENVPHVTGNTARTESAAPAEVTASVESPAPAESAAPAEVAPAPTLIGRIESKFPRGLIIRLIAYLFVGHLFAFFVYLLFVLGAENQ
ncbi:DUF6126 family protein [Streptomyces sp. NPDC057939]|uniref:DUF6126 family protein n=1 Tax=Streptomyces sp. NPDC057939 TaxID=3346284 RepID=UPI0036EECE9C